MPPATPRLNFRGTLDWALLLIVLFLIASMVGAALPNGVGQ